MDAIDEILATLWDPLKVGTEPQAVADLYGQAGRVVAEMLERGTTAAQLASYLGRAANGLGEPTDVDACMSAAAALLALRR